MHNRSAFKAIGESALLALNVGFSGPVGFAVPRPTHKDPQLARYKIADFIMLCFPPHKPKNIIKPVHYVPCVYIGKSNALRAGFISRAYSPADFICRERNGKLKKCIHAANYN
jgi:hypothetical protein